MKALKNLFTAAFVFVRVVAIAQTEIPQGFARGNIVLSDGNTITGFIKDNIRKEAVVIFIKEAGAKKKKYQGSDIISTEIDGAKYLCIKGDFFKVVCNGDVFFLQKSIDASGIPVYNGSEAIFSNGTPGKPGDYFIYSTIAKELKMVSKNTVETVAASSFAGCVWLALPDSSCVAPGCS